MRIKFGNLSVRKSLTPRFSTEALLSSRTYADGELTSRDYRLVRTFYDRTESIRVLIGRAAKSAASLVRRSIVIKQEIIKVTYLDLLLDKIKIWLSMFRCSDFYSRPSEQKPIAPSICN